MRVGTRRAMLAGKEVADRERRASSLDARTAEVATRAAARAESDGGGRPGGGHADGLAARRALRLGRAPPRGGDNVTRDGGHHNLSVDASVGDQKSVARRRRGPRERGKTCGHWIETSQQVHI